MASPEKYARSRIAQSQAEIRHSLEMIANGNPFAAEPSPTRRRDRLQAKANLSPAKARAFDAKIRKHSKAMMETERPPDFRAGAILAGQPVLATRADTGGAEALQGDTIDFVDVAFLARGARIARSVGRVAFANNGRGQGSGVLIGAGLFLTNNHVISTANLVRQFILEFDYERDEGGTRRAETRYALDPSIFVHDTVEGLDFSIVAVGERIKGPAELADFGVSPLSDASDKHMLGEFANIVQHPKGRLKEVVLRENRLVSRFEDFLHYVADTEPGSSGSPVYNSEWQMIALHHWGEPFGEPGDPVVPGSTEVNEGIRVSSIVRHLQENMDSYSPAAQARLNEALNATENPVNVPTRGEAARTNAETAVVEAKAGLSSENDSAAAIADAAELERLARLKEKEDARKELAQSKKAADLAEAQALIGTVDKSGIEGNVTVKDDAGKGEATLLAARALVDAGKEIAADIKERLSPGSDKASERNNIILIPKGEDLQFESYRQFLLETALLEKQFDATLVQAESLGKVSEPGGMEAAAPLTLAGVAVEAVANLGSFFQTDYEIGGLDITSDVDQLIAALGGHLLRDKFTVTVPLRHVPKGSAFAELLGTLPERIVDAEKRVAELKNLAQSEAATQAAAAVKAVVSRAMNFIAALGTADANGVLPITKVVQQKAICDALAKGSSYMLVVDVRAAVGGYYTKKNLWTFFGGLPFFAMGGTVVTYQLLDKDGSLHASGLIPRHGGYHGVRDVPKAVNADASVRPVAFGFGGTSRERPAPK